MVPIMIPALILALLITPRPTGHAAQQSPAQRMIIRRPLGHIAAGRGFTSWQLLSSVHAKGRAGCTTPSSSGYEEGGSS